MSYKVVFLGEGRVGKTSIGKRWVDGFFDPSMRSTISAAFFQKTVNAGSKKINIQLWDTAGQEEYHSLAPIYYKDAVAAILVYSVTDSKSFEKMQQWRKELVSSRGDNIKIILCGNKIDLPSQRTVQYDQAEAIAKQYGCPYFEVSAKTGQGIETMFLRLGEILSTIPLQNTGPTRRSHASLQVVDAEEKKQKGGCC
ncbi:small GTP-binding protein, putative [Trichomonas vaginalis G3]|uniref:Ras-related protein Rab-21 n=2 Tax=Trichomonas vaginalis TaxID=5722 RepID=A0A8U0WPA0_TRIV3|nr:small Rab GTPase RabE2 [Trichomonas vaginalis G3]AAX97475.1 small Rab GTPase RabE2 [Trichomonas vaginalis]EAX94134.1 small GTP-binding protein, putative [Trichomonas vaginalis G3]KAI5525056.1 small Rab GTPase RabE2 [Trichomonas vaginalis G3]|eukprot:XP_001307064.1 small GTP-binding protein [Trichomonas vaginalis G3]